MNSDLRVFNPRMLMVMVIMLVAALVVTFTASSCGSEVVEVPVDRIVEKEVVKVVEKEVPVEVIKEVEVTKEVAVEIPVTKEVIKEVEVPVTKEVIKEVEVTVEVDKDPGELVLYSGRKESLVGAIVEQFEDATGIDVKVKYDKTFPLAAMILEEGNNSPADIFFAQDPGGLGFLSAAGRLDQLPTDITDPVADWAKPADRTWVGLSGRARTLVHSTSLSADELPASLEDLTDPKWKGKIGWAPTNSSFQTMITGMRVVWGEEKTRTWLENMLANEPLIYPKNTPQVAAAASEEINIGLVNHYYLHRFVAEEGDTFNARNLYLSNGGPGSLVMVAGAGILNTAPNKENAEKFLKFMTSKVAQQYFTGQIYEYPVVDGVKTHKFLPTFAELNIPALSMEDLSDLEGTQAIFKELGMLD